MSNASKRAQTVANGALEQAAQSGVARAIAARKAAGVELTGADIEQVSGGLGAPLIINGSRPFDLGLVTAQPDTNITLPAVQSLGAVQGLGAAAPGAAGVQGMGMVA